jgi:uncharacterized protein YdiU (UPF0061 family)
MDHLATERPRIDTGLQPSRYLRLPDRFYQRAPLAPVAAPSLIKLNEALAREIGLDPEALASEIGVAILAGNASQPGVEPLALAYAGHQFGNFVPQLGDGRALLIGEAVDGDGRRFDVQLKGSGRTRFSRGGDGRAALGPVLREYVVSEAMAALGIPTSRTLAAVSTGETVWRETPQPGAIVARVAASHLRIGTFQYFAARQDEEGLRLLADHAIERHYPAASGDANPYLALLNGVIAAQARLIARWMLVGFIHGVMNTDNMTISGETIDYGPCAFMDAYHPATVFSSIDARGRYAYANQPNIAVWNLARLAETLLPLIDRDEDAAVEAAKTALSGFQAAYEAAFHAGVRRKFGLSTEETDDLGLASALLDLMAADGADFTLVFRALSDDAEDDGDRARALFMSVDAFDAWSRNWRERLAREPREASEIAASMRAVNPKHIARNHRVEEAIRAAVDRGDFEPFERLVEVLARPFDDQPDMQAYALPPKPEERVLQTFCGT